VKIKVRLVAIRNNISDINLDKELYFDDVNEDLSGEDEFGEYDYNDFSSGSTDFIFTLFNPATLTLTDILFTGSTEEDVVVSKDVMDRLNKLLGTNLTLDLKTFNIVINTIDERGLEIEIDTNNQELIGSLTAPLSYVQTMDTESEKYFTYKSMSDIENRFIGSGMTARCYPSIDPLELNMDGLEVRDYKNMTKNSLLDRVLNNLGEFYSSTIG